ncbi:MAG: hypothetical protein NVSMB32_12730 [Actinomycetota bacterium]
MALYGLDSAEMDAGLRSLRPSTLREGRGPLEPASRRGARFMRLGFLGGVEAAALVYLML